MASMQKRGISLLLVLVLVFSMIPSVSAAEITTEPGTEPAETTTPVTEETLATETSPPETTQPEETLPLETTEPETTETIPEVTEAVEGTQPVEESPSEKAEEETTPEEELSLSLMSLDDGVATIADTEIVGAPNAFANVFLLNGGIDIPSFDHVQHKEHLPLYSVYLKDQPGYENNYYVAYCIEPGVVLGESGGHTGSSTTVGGMTDGTGALEWLSREQVEAMGIVLLYGQREIARRADDESVRLQKLARHAATQVLIWEIASGWRSATPPYTRYDSTFYDAIVPELECAVQVWGTKFYLDGIDDAYNEIVAQMERHYKIPSFTTGSKSTAPSYELIADGNGKYSITLTDTNNILSQYTFTNTSNLTFSVSGNKLTVTANGPISDTLVAPTKQVPDLDSQVFYVWEYKEQQKLPSVTVTGNEHSSSPEGGHFWNYDVVVYPKQDTGIPTLTKEVRESASKSTGKNNGTDSIDDGFDHNATGSAGDVMEFQILSTLPSITSQATAICTYQFYDSMDPGLTYNKNLKDVKIEFFTDKGCTDKVATWVQGDGKFNVTYSSDDRHMTINITAAGLAEINGNTANTNGKLYAGYSNYTARVTYTATINSDATFVYGQEGNDNKVVLTWKRTSSEYYDTLIDDCHVYSFGIDITKLFSDKDSETAEETGMFKHVKFKIYNETDGYWVTAARNESEGVYYVTGHVTEEADATIFYPVTTEAGFGHVMLKGTEPDRYRITECETMDGYTLLKESIYVEIVAIDDASRPCDIYSEDVLGVLQNDPHYSFDGGLDLTLANIPQAQLAHNYMTASATVDSNSVTMLEDNGSANAEAPLTVVNTSGFDLPQTGDTGVAIFTVTGILLMAGAAVIILFTCRKKKSQQ